MKGTTPVLLILLLLAAAAAQAQSGSGDNFDYSINAGGATLTITNYTGSGGPVSIPTNINGLTVTDIGANAFKNMTSLTSVTIANSVTNIEDEAFYGCTGLTNAAIGNGVASIGAQAFIFCAGLSSVTIPGSVASIGGLAFYGCHGLTNVLIPNSTTNFGDYAFCNCTGLMAVYFLGNAPPADSTVFNSDENATVYYLPGTTGWNPQVQNSGASFGVQTNLFGFTITGGATSMAIVVEACTNLANPIWSPMATNTFTGGSSYFSDLQWTNYPARFYRLQSLTFAGLPAVKWNPQPQASGTRFGVSNNQFGFNITGTANIPIAVEACANLANPFWIRLQTLTLTNGLVYFSDPQWTNYPGRFYRIRSP